MIGGIVLHLCMQFLYRRTYSTVLYWDTEIWEIKCNQFFLIWNAFNEIFVFWTYLDVLRVSLLYASRHVPSAELSAIALQNTELQDSARAYSDGLASNFLLL
jgi:hypothetical protein